MDYSAYSEPNIQSYNGRIKDLPKMATPRFASNILFVTLWFAVGTPIYVILFVGLSFAHWIFLLLGVLLYIPLALVFWKFMVRSTDTGNDYTLRMALFAERNGFRYQIDGGRYDAEGSISSVLGRPMTSNLVQGTVEHGVPFRLCTTYGKGFYVLLTVQLPNAYPHILLDSNSNNFVVSNLLAHFPDSKEITLEGDFANYFRVFSAGSSVETLQILSPELMGRMVDYPKRADLEIVGDTLHIVLNYKKLTGQDMRMLFDAAAQILKDVGMGSNNARVPFDSSARIRPLT